MTSTDKYNDLDRGDLIEALEYEEEKLVTLTAYVQGMQSAANDKESLRILYILETKIKELIIERHCKGCGKPLIEGDICNQCSLESCLKYWKDGCENCNNEKCEHKGGGV